MRKTAFFILSLMLIVMAACVEGENNEADNLTNNDGQGAEDLPATTDENEENAETDEAGNVVTDPALEYRTKTGTFVGMADPHTVEIETEDGPVAYQIVVELRDKVESLEAGDQVSYTYYAKGEQLIIESIDKILGNNLIISTGTFIGLADNHTVEIETKDGPLAFQISPEVREIVDQFKEGDTVQFYYSEDGDLRLISRIHRVDM